MKKFNLLFIGILSMSQIYAQDITDALRYSLNDIQGTARYRAMSGAFGALGGDMSAVSLNPAGSAIFTSSHASMTVSNINRKNDVSFLTNGTNSSNSDFDLSQAGAALVFNNSNESSPWKKFVLGFTYDRTSNYENDWRASGINTASIDNYFINITEQENVFFGDLKLLNGEFIEEAYADIGNVFGFNYQQVFLGYYAGIIDPVNLDNTTNDDETNYTSNISGGNFNQDYFLAETGYNGKTSFNFSTQYTDNFYFGINLNTHFVDYDRLTRFSETNTNAGSGVTDLRFDNSLHTQGTGFSFQLGGIAKLNKNIRIGVVFDSPTWYRLEDDLVQYIDSNNADVDIEFISDIVNLFPEYRIQTPGKLTGSLAYVFGERGLISFDYSRKDYSNIKFKPTSDPSFVTENNLISNNLTDASTYKFGGEYKHKQFSFRAGYRFEESPYKDGKTIGDLNGYSLGLGYSFGRTKLDLAFDQSERDSQNQLYSTGLSDAAIVNTKLSNITLSLAFNL